VLHNDNTGGVTGRCLEPHDVCVSKLLAGRLKDNEFSQALIRAGVVEPATLLERLERTDATPDERRSIEVMIESAA